jgi:hypothetical protein
MKLDERSLPEIVASLKRHTKTLNEMDDEISMSIAKIERFLRAKGVERVYSVKLPDGADLGWSKHISRHRNSRRWRFVIRLDDEVWDLMSCSREERAEIFTCGAMDKLLAQIIQRSP